MRIPIDSDTTLRKLVAVCHAHGVGGVLEEERKTLERVAARRKLQQGRLGEAICHYAAAKEPKRVAKIADKLFLDYVKLKNPLRGGNNGNAPSSSSSSSTSCSSPSSSDLVFSDIIDSLPHSILYGVSDRLSFLARYREFHHLCYTTREYTQAGQLLCLLLTSGAAPKYIWPTLLLDAVPLLEGEVVAFNADETYELMRCLEEIFSSHRAYEYLGMLAGVGGARGGIGERIVNKGETIADAAKMFEVVRLALVRNLARTLI